MKKNSFFIILGIVMSISCTKQYRINFNLEEMSIESCDKSKIYSVHIFNIDKLKTLTINFDDQDLEKASNKIFLTRYNKYYKSNFDSLILEPSSRYLISVPRSHTSGSIILYTDEIGNVIRDENETPCSE